jgi:hypothetical protein
LGALLIYPVIAIWYATDWHFFDNAEPTIPAIGWLFYLGAPLYHATDAPERYALIYGPMTFVAHGVALAVFGPSITASKGLGIAAGILSLVLLYRAVRLHHSVLASATLVGICALLLLCFRHYSFWTRPEPLQLLSVSGALLAAATGRGNGSAALAGLAAGLMWNLKFTGPLYTAPVAALLYQRLGLKPAILALAVASLAAAAPFACFPNVSLVNYLTWVQLSAHTGLLLHLLKQNIEWAAYLSLPILLSYFARAPEQRPATRTGLLLIALFSSMAGVILSAAKPGAGPYHLLPFLPVVVYVVALHTSGFSPVETRETIVPQATLAFLVVASCIAIAQQAQFVTTISARRLQDEADDIQRFVDKHEGAVAMGYGQTEALSLLRPMLVFKYGTYLLDQPAVREHQLAGVEVPRTTAEALARCDVVYWLVPMGESPFSGVNSYDAVAGAPLYPVEFRRTFAANHTRVDSTEYYDVWQCHSTAGRE